MSLYCASVQNTAAVMRCFASFLVGSMNTMCWGGLTMYYFSCSMQMYNVSEADVTSGERSFTEQFLIVIFPLCDSKFNSLARLKESA